MFLQLYLDFLGSFAAQLNVLILKYTVDTIIELMVTGEPLSKRFYLLTIINIVLLSKEVLYSIIQFGKKFYGEELRIYIKRDILQTIVKKTLTYRMEFYTS